MLYIMSVFVHAIVSVFLHAIVSVFVHAIVSMASVSVHDNAGEFLQKGKGIG